MSMPVKESTKNFSHLFLPAQAKLGITHTLLLSLFVGFDLFYLEKKQHWVKGVFQTEEYELYPYTRTENRLSTQRSCSFPTGPFHK